MKTIWKFPIDITDQQSVEMPDGARILTVQVQGGEVCLWAEVDSTAPKMRRTVYVFGTGHPLSPDLSADYVGTIQIRGGALVFHVYA